MTAWLVTFATFAALARAIPEVNPAVIADRAGAPHSVSSLLGLLIPTDLFTAFTQNYVPAVVIFCIFYGVAMQTLKDKQALLSMLEAASASGTGSCAWRLSGCSLSSRSPRAPPPCAISSTWGSTSRCS